MNPYDLNAPAAAARFIPIQPEPRMAGPLWLAVTLAAVVAGQWSPSRFPNPTTVDGSVQCGLDGKPGFVCDPDGVLGRGDALRSLEVAVRDLEARSARPCGDAGSVGTQFAIAVVQQVQPGVSIEGFARSLHTAWGVGHRQVGPT